MKSESYVNEVKDTITNEVKTQLSDYATGAVNSTASEINSTINTVLNSKEFDDLLTTTTKKGTELLQDDRVQQVIKEVVKLLNSK